MHTMLAWDVSMLSGKERTKNILHLPYNTLNVSLSCEHVERQSALKKSSCKKLPDNARDIGLRCEHIEGQSALKKASCIYLTTHATLAWDVSMLRGKVRTKSGMFDRVSLSFSDLDQHGLLAGDMPNFAICICTIHSCLVWTMIIYFMRKNIRR